MAIITGKIESYEGNNVIIKGHNPVFIAPENRDAAKKNFPVGTAVKLTHIKGTATAMENLDEAIIPPEGGTFKRASDLPKDEPAKSEPVAAPAATATSATAQKKTESASKDSSPKPSTESPKKGSKKDTYQTPHQTAAPSTPPVDSKAGAKEQSNTKPQPEPAIVPPKETEPESGGLKGQGNEVAANASSDPPKGLSTLVDEIENVTLGVSLRFGAYNNIKVEVSARTPAAATVTFRSLVEEQKRYIMRTVEDIRKQMEKFG